MILRPNSSKLFLAKSPMKCEPGNKFSRAFLPWNCRLYFNQQSIFFRESCFPSRTEVRKFHKSGGKVLIVVNTTSTCPMVEMKFNLGSSCFLFFVLYLAVSRGQSSAEANVTIAIKWYVFSGYAARIAGLWSRLKDLTNTDGLHYRKSPWIVMCVYRRVELADSITVPWLKKIWALTRILKCFSIWRLKYHKKCSNPSNQLRECDLRCRKVDAGKTKTKYNFKV